MPSARYRLHETRLARTRWVLLFLLPVMLVNSAVAQDEDELDELQPGLVARYSTDRVTVERIDPDIAFDWGRGSPDERLVGSTLRVQWSSLLLIKTAGDYRLHAHVDGRIRVRIDSTVVLEGSSDGPQWLVSDVVALTFGERTVDIEYERTGDNARCFLGWSSNAFPLEPIPSHVFFQPESSARRSGIDRGRFALQRARCLRCHESGSPTPAGPDLRMIGVGLTRDSILEKLVSPPTEASQMPHFGLDRTEAGLIAEYLLRKSAAVELIDADPPKDAEKARSQGERLISSLGCLACHRRGDQLGTDEPAAISLATIRKRRSQTWVRLWLDTPEKLNADHQMPRFALSAEERQQIALALADDRLVVPTPSPTGYSDERAMALLRSSRCAACHRVPGIDTPQPVRRLNSQSPATNSCIETAPDRSKGRPSFPQLDKSAVRAYLETCNAGIHRVADFEYGRRLVRERNCVSCHPRGTGRGLADVVGQVVNKRAEFRGQSSLLLPPNLTAVGDKLTDDALVTAFSGKQKSRRLDWLHVRMPQFRHSEDERRALSRYFIGHDRIPDSTNRSRGLGHLASSKATDQTLVVGQSLLGARGFSCIACHQVGGYRPPKVALGTRGSDLIGLAQRMRPEFFLRWSRSPLRVTPGVEMPNYIKAVAGVSPSHIDEQLATLWQALNQPQFQPPTNPSVVEQHLVVDNVARVVRDVFTVRPENGSGYVSRALAIGLPGGHNVLYDLDSFALRQWTFGDFARQRTSGKSWFWDLEGVSVVSGIVSGSDYRLRTANGAVLATSPHEGRHGRLLSYGQTDNKLTVLFELRFDRATKGRSVRLRETIQPISNAQRGGWVRKVKVVDGLANGEQILVGRPIPSSTIGQPMIERLNGGASWQRIADSGREFTAVPTGANAQLEIAYTSILRPSQARANPQPTPVQTPVAVTSTPGFDGVRLPLDGNIMPTALTWLKDGTLAFTSLKGHVFLAKDTDGDGLEDHLVRFEEGLAAPFGILADGDSLIVAHKPELLRLRDTNGDGVADQREVIASGWGYTEDYHDWTCGIVRDRRGHFFVGLGSDYGQPRRPLERALWRGKVLDIAPNGQVTPVGHDFRYPIGLAIRGDDIFISDNQGVQNTFNEINHLAKDTYYGVPSRREIASGIKREASPPALQVPHPWTRSVNGLTFVPPSTSLAGFAGHGLGAEYDSRFLMRFTVEEVDGVMQGATYEFSRPNSGAGGANFVGPICIAIGPDERIYVGNIHDSGWLGGQNTGAITRLTSNDGRPNGLRELRTLHDGFQLEFFAPVDAALASSAANYAIQGYTRVYKSGYSTPDSGRHTLEIEGVRVSRDRKSVQLRTAERRSGYVYEVNCAGVGKTLWPSTGHYTLHRIPKAK